MKIHDIISESPVQEGPVDLLKLAGKGIAAGAKWLAQTGTRSDLVSMMSKNPNFIKNTLRGTPPTVAQVEKIYGPRAGEIFAKDPNFMAKVLKQFHAERLAGKAANTAGQTTKVATQAAPAVTQAAAGATKELVKKIPITGLVAKAISVYGIYDMVQDYNKGVAYFDEQLKSGKMTPDEYKAGVNHLKATLVAQIAASTVVFSALKHSTGWSTLGLMLRSRQSPMLRTIGENMGTLSSAARAALIMLLDTKEARAMWSDMFAGGMMDTIGSMTFNGITELFNKAKEKAKDITNTSTEPADNTASATDKDATSTAKPDTAPSTNTSPYKSNVPSTSTYKGDPMFKGIN